MARLSPKEKDYCKKILEEGKDYIPYNYRNIIVERAEKEGLTITVHQVQNFKRGKAFDMDIAKLFKAEIDERKEALEKLN